MSLDLDELCQIFEAAAHTRDLPQYKNIAKELAARLQEIDDGLAPAAPKPKAIPSAEIEKNPNFVPPKQVERSL